MLDFALEAMIGGANAAGTEPPFWHCTVVEHERRMPDLAVIRLQTNVPYTYKAGQHGALESPLLPHTWRQYSMASAPQADGIVEFHIRMTRLGGVSEALVERTHVGDRLRLGPAHGMMTLDDEVHRDLLLVAGGTGLAPIKAILEDLESRQINRRTHLFVGARDRAGLYDWDSLVELESRCSWLTVVPVLSEEPWFSGETGMVADALTRYGAWSKHSAYVSGPPEMVDTTITRLLEMNVPIENVHYDSVHGKLDG